MEDSFDVLIIGAGQAGIPLARALAKAGRKVALAEHKLLGGSCVNFGCTPTKAAIASARVAHLARRAADYGIAVDSVRVDFPKVLQRAREIAAASRQSLGESFERADSPVLLHGHARFTGRAEGNFKVDVADGEMLAREVVLDTGTRSIMPPIANLSEIDVIDSENWLDHPQLPRHLIVVGGGYIGLEMGQFYRRMGSEVTIVQLDAQIAGHEDRDVAKALQGILESEGIRFRLGASAKSVRRLATGFTLGIDSGAGHQEVQATHLFVATGRRPNTDDLGLETIGITPTDKGTIEVDERLHAKADGLWAVGDIRGGPMFTHTSWDDFRILESQMLGDGSRTLDRVVPYAIFTDPQLGRVGMTETDAKLQGRRVKVGRFEMNDSGKARELGETQGFIKVVVDAGSGKILGAAVLAEEAAELVHLYVELMNADAPYTVMKRALHVHPTLAEAAQSALSTL
jgi:pyruvate/2-oxoglutarate dehydrogenase complex dihydrolipoamide dehydrogenase (E3) component